MKKMLSLIAVLLCTSIAFAQNRDTATQDTSGMRMMHDSMMQSGMNGMHGMGGKMKDCIMMMNGKAMVIRGGKHMVLDQQMTLPNGTVVMPDGTVKMSDGTTRMLKSDECIYMDGTMGKIGKMGNMKGKMKSAKDSTNM